MAFVVPVAVVLAVAGTMPSLVRDANKSPQQIMSDTLPIIEAVSDIFVPGLGTAEKIIFIILGPSHPMTRAEEEIWMQRLSTETQR